MRQASWRTDSLILFLLTDSWAGSDSSSTKCRRFSTSLRVKFSTGLRSSTTRSEEEERWSNQKKEGTAAALDYTCQIQIPFLLVSWLLIRLSPSFLLVSGQEQKSFHCTSRVLQPKYTQEELGHGIICFVYFATTQCGPLTSRYILTWNPKTP